MTKTFVNFTAEQVLAALSGEVVVVREAVKGFPSIMSSKDILPELRDIYLDIAKNQCPYGPIGNTLWIREGWAKFGMVRPDGSRYTVTVYRADAPIGYENMASWRPANRMPRLESRLNVTVKSVAVEQVDGGWEWVVEMIQEKNDETRK